MPQEGDQPDFQEESTMSDEATQQEAEHQNPEEQKPEQADEKQETRSFDEAYVKKLRDEAAGYRVKLKEYEDRDKSDAQKSADRIAELEKENAAYKQRDQVQAWAKEVAKDSPELAPLLRGSSREELEEHFAQLSSLAKKPTPKAKPDGKSPEDRDKTLSAAEALRAMRKG